MPGDVPITFVTDFGTATAVAHVIDVLGAGGAFTTGAGNVITVTASSSGAVSTLTGNSGGAISPVTGNINTVGTGSITIAGAGNTLTTQLTGLTNHSVQVGAGTATLTQLGVGTNGQVLIGATAADPAFATLTSIGATITYTLGANSLNLEAGSTVPTIFGANSGSASPFLNTLNILGASVSPGTSPVATMGAGNNITVDVQRSQAIAAADSTKVGLSNFDSASFAVDTNGFVTLIGGAAAIEKVNVQTGTSPVVPSSGSITINGAVVAAGTNPIRTDGTGASTLAVEVQISQALAATDATKIGLANFDSAAFDVDANGFVQLNGGGIASTSFTVDANTAPGTNPVVPTASGGVTIEAAAVAAHSVPIETRSRAANTFKVEVQEAAAVAATDVTKSGISHFNSSEFTVDANGFVSLVGGGSAIESVNVQTGTSPIVPSSGAITINGAVVAAGTNPVRSDGTGANTLAIEVQKSQAIAAADATKIGLAAFDSADFTVDANGFVSAATTGFLKTLTGNSGGAIAPVANNINTVGTGSITIAGAGSTLTTQLTGLTNHSVQVGAGTATLTQLTVGTNGQVLIGATAADPAFATLTSSDSSISFTTGANTLSLQVAGGTTVGKTITGDTGGALSPTAGNWNLLGSGSITTSGSGSTLTTQLTGLTNHAVLVGAGTTTITKIAATANTGAILQNNASADPSYSTATYPSTTTVSQILYSSATNVVSGLATANKAVLTTGATGIPVLTALATDGQVIIGSTAGVPAAATLTAGTGIAITNGSNSITIAATTSGFAWSDTSGTVTAVAENGYFITGTTTSTLPASPSEGDTVKYIVDTTSLLTITGNTGQKIRIGTTLSASAGTAVNTQRGDSLELVYRTTGTTWFALSGAGGWNVT